MIDYLYLGLYRIFGGLLRIMPRSGVIIMMRLLARFAHAISPKHRRTIATNLEIAFPHQLSANEKKKIGIDAFMNLLDTTLGIIERDGMAKEEVIQNVTFEGEAILQAYRDAGKKVILITGHQGNWELLSQAIAIKFDLTLVGVGRKLDSDLMDKILKANRERFNVEMVYKKGAMKGCIKALNQNKVVGILVDQSIRLSQSITVQFFGKPATHTPLASILSRKFGVDLIPAFISTNDYIHYHITIHDPIKTIKTNDHEEDLKRLTQAQADVMEQVIREHPNEWFWMHKRWKRLNEGLYE